MIDGDFFWIFENELKFIVMYIDPSFDGKTAHIRVNYIIKRDIFNVLDCNKIEIDRVISLNEVCYHMDNFSFEHIKSILFESKYQIISYLEYWNIRKKIVTRKFLKYHNKKRNGNDFVNDIIDFDSSEIE